MDIQHIENTWPLTNVKLEKVLQENGDRITALISSDQGKFVHKTASPWKDANALKKDTAVFDFLNSINASYISKLLKTKKGENFASTSIGNKFICLFEYVEGKNPDKTVEVYEKLGSIMAELHSVENYPYKTDFDPKYIREHNFIENAKQFEFADEYLKIAQSLPDFTKSTQALIHTDISCGNSIEKSDGSLALIDWDDVGVGPIVLDLGYMLGQCTTENLEINQELVGAFFNSYFSKRTITAEDRKMIFDGCLFFHLMYIIHGDIPKRWNKIQWLVKNREFIESLIPNKF